MVLMLDWTLFKICETVIQQTANPSNQDFDIEFNPIPSRPTRYAPDTTQQTFNNL